MTKLHKTLLQLIDDESGQDMIECALIAGLLTVATGATVPGVAEDIVVALSKMSSYVDNATAAYALAS